MSSSIEEDESTENRLIIPEATQDTTPDIINLNLHKAGLSGFDKEKINKIIQEASKGSNFYSFQQKRQKRIDHQITQFQNKLKAISEAEKCNATLRADTILSELEAQRTLNRIIVHFDMDMFFAAVELKNNPKIANEPVAVGTLSMISTSNYVARKYGVRSAMAGFIAKKLCPQLILIKPKFKNYAKESELVMNILMQYDPNLRNLSLDEVYLDLTEYVFERYSHDQNVDISELYKLDELSDDIWNFSYDIVNNIRARVFNETQLTISAGISCNSLLSKVCTDINKPDGQFMVKGHKCEIIEFVSNIEVRKFPGIGPVRGQILTSLNICTGKDIYKERSTILNLFSEFNAISYLRVCLGIGSSYFESEDTAQKSHSREKTIGELSDFNEICNLLKDISSRLSSDLKSRSQQCRTITLKLKKITFEVYLKSRSIASFTDDEQVIFDTSKLIWTQEFSKFPGNRYRLIGIKLSNMREKESSKGTNSNQLTIDQLLKSIPKSAKTQDEVIDIEEEEETNVPFTYKSDLHECRLCEQMFDDSSLYEMHKLYCEGDLNEALFETQFESSSVDIAANHSDNSSDGLVGVEQITEKILAPLDSTNSDIDPIGNNENNNNLLAENDNILYLRCPICNLNSVFKNNDDLNHHIDTCLNKEICIQLTQVPSHTSPNRKIVNNSKKTKRINSPVSSTSSSKNTNSNKKIKPNLSKNETVKLNQPKIEDFFR